MPWQSFHSLFNIHTLAHIGRKSDQEAQFEKVNCCDVIVLCGIISGVCDDEPLYDGLNQLLPIV
ncbi:hypothetical protein MAR_023580 [Mya arenaria]|uniref:Uncharacterized protein n=1 Tax=Mya arenaria TaxID=6604 RepID=A0ABY7DNE7_MYAAR|nr:hypothetical protein MAR_023580 [Mya arenaria]